MNQSLKDLLDSFGAIAEMYKAFYDNLVLQGFTKQQAVEFTKDFMTQTTVEGMRQNFYKNLNLEGDKYL